MVVGIDAVVLYQDEKRSDYVLDSLKVFICPARFQRIWFYDQ
jgi:hypothetical protein